MTEKEKQISQLAHRIMWEIFKEDRSGRLLYLFAKQLCATSKLKAFDACIDDKYKYIVITKNEYDDEKDKRKCANCGRHDGWNGCGEYVEDCMKDYDAYSNWTPKENIKEDF